MPVRAQPREVKPPLTRCPVVGGLARAAERKGRTAIYEVRRASCSEACVAACAHRTPVPVNAAGAARQGGLNGAKR